MPIPLFILCADFRIPIKICLHDLWHDMMRASCTLYEFKMCPNVNCPQYFHKKATSNGNVQNQMPICKCKVEGEIPHKYDRALEIVNRLSISHSGSASLRKVWAGTRWTLQATSRTASPLQASSGAGSPILQSAHFYAKPGSLGNCLELEGGLNICWCSFNRIW